MKHYSVMCLFSENQFDFGNIDVFAENPEEAKLKAVAALKANGHPNARLAPGCPDDIMVIELHDKKEYEVTMTILHIGQRVNVTVKTKAANEREAIDNAIDALKHDGYCTDSIGIQKVTEGWH